MILVVGATGVVGDAVVRAARRRGQAVCGLARRTPDEWPHDGSDLLAGDARLPDLALAPDVAAGLRRDVRHVVIAAGPVDLRMTLARANDGHLAVVSGVLGFLATCPPETRCTLVSSFLAPGDVTFPVPSSYLPEAGRFRSIYAWAKAEGERRVRALDRPITVVRPGHVVPDAPGADQPVPEIGIFGALRYLAAAWPTPVDGTRRYWCGPASFVGEVVVAAADRPGRSSIWAVDPASPTYGELLDAIAVRYGFAARRIDGRAGRLLLAALRLGVLGRAVPGDVLAQLDAHVDLDLRCLRALIDAGAVEAPADRSYLIRALDRAVEQQGDLR